MTAQPRHILGNVAAVGWLLLGGTLSSAAVAADDDPITSVVSSIHVDPKQHAGAISAVNGSISIGEEAVVGSVDAVNGSIHIGNQVVAGSVSAVNGGINVGEHAHVSSVATVNGSIHLNSGAQLGGSAATVNGSLHLEQGTDVKGELRTVNGAIHVQAAHVGGRIETSNGDIDVGTNSRVDGGILVKESQYGWFGNWFGFLWPGKPQRVVIGPGAVVKGTLRFEKEVRLYVSNRASIGPVEGAKPIAFTGDHAPED